MSTVDGAGEEPGFLPQDAVAAAVPCQLGHYLPDNAERCFHVIMWQAAVGETATVSRGTSQVTSKQHCGCTTSVDI